jgi:hypothetical protein
MKGVLHGACAKTQPGPVAGEPRSERTREFGCPDSVLTRSDGKPCVKSTCPDPTGLSA